jgi:competence protein ComEA
VFYLSRGEKYALFLLLALLLAGAAALTHARGVGAGRGDRQPIFVEATDARSAGGEIAVHVAGAVAQPGVYRLPIGSRVVDAIDRAGGALPGADTAALNQAAQLHDQDKLTVPAKSDAPPLASGQAHQSQRAGRISLSTATTQQLESLPGIGPVYAERIIAYRDRMYHEQGHGFQSVDELLNVPGIGPQRLALLRDRVTP